MPFDLYNNTNDNLNMTEFKGQKVTMEPVDYTQLEYSLLGKTAHWTTGGGLAKLVVSPTTKNAYKKNDKPNYKSRYVSVGGNQYQDNKYNVLISKSELEQRQRRQHKKAKQNKFKRASDNINFLTYINFRDDPNNKFITLTYRKPVDKRQSNQDIQEFIKDFKRIKNIDTESLYYLIVAEYTKRGRIHYHVLLRALDRQKLTISRDERSRIWKHGTMYVENITSNRGGVKGLAEYLNPLNKDKRERLDYYPKNIRMYRASRNLCKPKVEKKLIDKTFIEQLNAMEQKDIKMYEMKNAITGEHLFYTFKGYYETKESHRKQNKRGIEQSKSKQEQRHQDFLNSFTAIKISKNIYLNLPNEQAKEFIKQLNK